MKEITFKIIPRKTTTKLQQKSKDSIKLAQPIPGTKLKDIKRVLDKQSNKKAWPLTATFFFIN